MALELTVTAKGQLTLRQAVLDHLKIRPGEKVGVALLPDGRVELRPADSRPSIAQARGCLKRPDQKPATLQEMQDAIESAAL